MTKISEIKGLLIDLEGVIYSDNEIIKDSVNTISKLKKNFKIRYLTNTTTTSRNSIFNKLIKLNLPVEENDIFSPSIAVNYYLNKNNLKRIYIMGDDRIKTDFKDFIFDDHKPEVVIIGDVYKKFNWDSLNKVFKFIFNNDAILIALHKNRYCKRDDEIGLDLGPFIKALEYASFKESIVIGKPEKEFFNLAINSLGLPKNQIAMIGDDIISDIEGAINNNIYAIQVKTGKYQKTDESNKFTQPNLRIDSINKLPEILSN